ncbi:beta-mannosidase isoform X1 [Pelobates cultripes]|uniref:Beta-mannosidase n=1 Tax=Pelobates cultripes TaxID=61616 RepID=A0AAD1SGS3_PELCU|nr:beta-mannosidase isoform X1 [Pelobates cultripes]CAH2301237.1 beta-mannosidase isoform X1 [Pelobates cultripes]CAH2301238.1 beta-mannosidase isoform X1 [Pelobates cultripes]
MLIIYTAPKSPVRTSWSVVAPGMGNHGRGTKSRDQFGALCKSHGQLCCTLLPGSMPTGTRASGLIYREWWLLMGLVQLCSGTLTARNGSSQVISLNGKWEIQNSNSSVKLQGDVPGCVHSALYSWGIIKDPYIRFNDIAYKWIAHDEWIYSKTFTVPTEIRLLQRVSLVCEGIDTVSSISLNSILIGNTNNMFSRYTFDISKLIVEKNYIEIKFRSAVGWAKEKSTNHSYDIPPECPPEVQNGECHVNFIRKAQCSFSWDWGPSFPTQGIWKDIKIEAYNVFHLDYISYVPVFDKNTSQWMVVIESVFDVITTNPLQGRVEMKISELKVDQSRELTINPGQRAIKVIVKIDKNTPVALWWPKGYGSQTGYEMTIRFQFEKGNIVEKTIKVYFRSVELVEEPIASSPGLSFYLQINGIPIFLKGSNWIPADSFQDKISSNKLQILLKSVVDANMNTLRVWGGGIYESDEFYQLCDELGIMVWQDFMFACALYPTDTWFLDTVREEVTHQMRRLKSHPSIIVWSANNENEAAIASDWFSIPSKMREMYLKDYLSLYIKTIRIIILEMDNTRPFIPSSPTNGKETIREGWLAKNPYDMHYGDIHYYSYLDDCWNWKTYPRPRLASEYGFQSWPSFSTIYKVSVPEDWSYTSNFAYHRQHHSSGNEEMMSQAELHYRMPTNSDPLIQFQDTLYLTQVMQAQCIKLQTEFYRRSMTEIVDGLGHTMGALYWQLNDIWQAPSWSSIEYGGKWKMLHYYAKNFFAPVSTSGFEDRDILYIYGVSDLLEDQNFKLAIRVYKWDSLQPVCERITEELKFNARSSGPLYKESIPELLSQCSNATRQTHVVVFHLLHQGQPYGVQNWHFLSSLKEAKELLKPNITVSITQDKMVYVFTMVTSSIAPFVWLDVWDIPGRFSNNGFLLVEEKTSVCFYPWDSTTVEELEKALHVTTLRDIY